VLAHKEKVCYQGGLSSGISRKTEGFYNVLDYKMKEKRRGAGEEVLYSDSDHRGENPRFETRSMK